MQKRRTVIVTGTAVATVAIAAAAAAAGKGGEERGYLIIWQRRTLLSYSCLRMVWLTPNYMSDPIRGALKAGSELSIV